MFDTIVIGAGAAGLAAARTLSGAGKRVLILEARARIGGRIFTLHVPSLPSPIELGAEFIHGESATTFSIVDTAGLAALELPDTHCWSRDGRWERVADFWGQIDRVRASIGPLRRDISFASFLRGRRDLPPRLRELARTFVEGYHAAHADRISALALRGADSEQQEDGGTNRQFRLAGGQEAIVEWLRSGLDPDLVELRLGTVVSHVEWSKGSVRVACRSAAARTNEVVRARAAVLTIPIGVWKAPRDQEGAITFDPPLREKQRVLERIEAGHVVKVALQFRERFWDSVNFLHSSDRFVPTWWTTAPLRSPVVVAWAGGHAADALLAEGEEALHDRVLDSMAAAWNIPRRRLAALLVRAHTHDWQRDPYARCAYSYAAVGGSDAPAMLARPVAGTLFFAGEATSGDETGTVAGAIDSGRRAAKQLLRKERSSAAAR